MFKGQIIFVELGMLKCPCSQTFKFVLDREMNMKIQLHNKSCDKGPGLKFAKNPRRAMTMKEYQCMAAERREFCE